MLRQISVLPFRVNVWARSAVAVGFLIIGTARGSEPLDPLPIPFFSMDLTSPTVIVSPPGGVGAADVLTKVPGFETPAVAISADALGIGIPGDELDGMSFNRADMARQGTFVLLYSVDRFTQGDVPPDPGLVEAGVPFNVADQAERGHAAGDGFFSTNLFDRDGIISDPLRAVPSGVLVVNHYDEGGSDFVALPRTSARDFVTGEIDDVDAIAEDDPVLPGMRGSSGIYFTVSGDSPSLFETLPSQSGADVFFHPDPRGVGFPLLFATAEELGLLPPDDINGLVVLDENGNGVFDPGDQVLFTLAPWSPSVFTPGLLPNISENGAADVFSVRNLAPGLIEVRLFAAAADLGLRGPFDNVDALEVIACDDALTCAVERGIRLIRGDWDNDGDVDGDDFPDFAACISGPIESEEFESPSSLCLDVFDYNGDLDIDLDDFSSFQIVFGFGVEPPKN